MNWQAVAALAAVATLVLTIFTEWPKLVARFQAIRAETGITLTTGAVFLLAFLPMALLPLLNYIYPDVSLFRITNGRLSFWLYTVNILAAIATPIVILNRDVFNVRFMKRLISFYLIIFTFMIIALMAYAYKPF